MKINIDILQRTHNSRVVCTIGKPVASAHDSDSAKECGRELYARFRRSLEDADTDGLQTATAEERNMRYAPTSVRIACIYHEARREPAGWWGLRVDTVTARTARIASANIARQVLTQTVEGGNGIFRYEDAATESFAENGF